ncbi:hypothetical protein COMNV_01731 [Commensalibacter sp. Nvir]|uniref:GNAT family N-acetyltransferase n=1 Tax=Commensalibacter sp. Nvir TaxID=3069817 RepID=UPI002D56FDFF|nr:hypothetical protein COMNV_01731 [Commensalibacter sp. Nvir]
MNTYTIEQIPIVECLKLRKKILAPFSTLEECKLSEDDQGRHYGYISQDKVLSCLSIFKRPLNAYQIRKFATDTDYQKQGIGSTIFHFALNLLKEEASSKILINARSTAIGFYRKFGFQICGECYMKANITYQFMELSLTPSTHSSK